MQNTAASYAVFLLGAQRSYLSIHHGAHFCVSNDAVELHHLHGGPKWEQSVSTPPCG